MIKSLGHGKLMCTSKYKNIWGKVRVAVASIVLYTGFKITGWKRLSCCDIEPYTVWWWKELAWRCCMFSSGKDDRELSAQHRNNCY